MTIRALRREDAPALAGLEGRIFSVPWSQADFEALTKRDYCRYLVAEKEDEVVGLCGYTASFGEGFIDNVFVSPDCRREGVAKRLLTELIRQGEAAGITAFTLEVRVSNAPAIRLYEKLGFVSAGIRPGFYEKPREDAMIMWRYQELRERKTGGEGCDAGVFHVSDRR